MPVAAPAADSRTPSAGCSSAAGRTASRPAARGVMAAARLGSRPLVLGQQHLWLHAQLAPELPVYNEPITIHRRGALDVAPSSAPAEIMRRHEAWRTTFPAVTASRVQASSRRRPALPVVDLRGLPDRAGEAEALRLATEDARGPSTSRGPLSAALLVRLRRRSTGST